jgi:hypothetical protein
MTRPAVKTLTLAGQLIILLALATWLGFLANGHGNTALMWLAGTALLVTQGCVLLIARPQRFPGSRVIARIRHRRQPGS